MAALLLVLLYLSVFPAIQQQAEKFVDVVKNYPKAFLDAFGVELSQLSFVKLEGFLTVEHFSFMWPLMIILLIVSQSGKSIAGEVEKGTIELILSQPVSRTKIYFAKYFAAVSSMIIFLIISVFGIIPIAAITNIDYEPKSYLIFAVLGALFGLATVSVSLFFSVLSSEKGRAYFLSAGVLVVMYTLKIVSSLRESLENLKYLSFFYYYNPGQAMIHQELDTSAVIVFISVSIVFTVGAAFWFTKRDIAV